MSRTCITLMAAVLLLAACGEPAPAPPPDSATLLSEARTAMGGDNLTSIEISGAGQDATVGQPWNINEGWPMWDVQDYNRVIDYAATASRQSAVREIADPGKLGGGGAQPGAGPQNQNTTVTADSGFNQKLQIWLTPHGFLDLAAGSNPSVASETMDGAVYNVASFAVADDDISHEMRGYFNAETNILETVQTWVDNPVYGDMPIEAEFGNYQDFDGVMFPTSYVQKQGGFDTLNLTVDTVVANTTASAAPPEGGGRGGRGGFGGRGGRGGGADADPPPPFVEIGEGIFVIDGGYQSVAVEFAEFSVVIDGLQNNARAADIIEITKEAIPGKPIGYYVNTHLHFDHIGGIRDMVAEGATIVTHQDNVAFLEDVLDNPRTMNPDRLSESGASATVMGAADTYVLEDATQLLELYKLEGSLHANDMMIAYLPSINTIVSADLVQPWMNPAFGGGPDAGPHPFLVHLAGELDRIGMAYDQFVPVHRPNPGPTVPREAFLAAAGR